ncbi:ATP-binding cassette domain-containing protein [Sneathia vaginalis]|uniref:ATP-binding cassette domain-containing protein n=1 Tax=Sneathia vaginalis TaxID=187101 RepID=UPI0025511B19|nr:ATP-binding cassette domain-containing protein [Sneathia vaginalis]MDK9582480.1 ATP-binding cassette domain-containing protein [Sneathia vaginalis]
MKKYIILGKSGSGKSSLIKSILGLITYDGVIKINDEDINTFNMKSIYNNIT